MQLPGFPRRSALALVSFSLFSTLVAGAQPAQNPAVAQALFEEAQKLVAASDYARACPKFKASYDLDPGGGTLLNLADCYEKEGRTALAWSTFKEAEVAARRDGRAERAAFANKHISDLEGRLVYLEVTVPERVRVPDLVLEVDGSPLVEAAWGSALPVDPGEHVVRAKAPGKRAFERTLNVATVAGTREVVEVPPLEDASEPTAPSAVPTDSNSTTTVADEAAPSGTQRTVGWVVTAGGAVSLGVGGYFGVRAMSRWGDRKDGCIGGCTEEAKTAGDEASDAANIATIGVGVGLLAVGVGVVLLLSAPDPEEAVEHGNSAAARLSFASIPGGGELSFRSTW